MHVRKNVLENKEIQKVQADYIQKLLEINNTKNKLLKVCISTYGCAMNAHDSEKLLSMTEQMGYTETKVEEEADLIIYNTCCVRENAENKVYGNLGFLKGIKTKNPDVKIVLCGCMMQQDAVVTTIKKKYKHVDLIFGTFNLYRFPELFHSAVVTNDMIIDVWEEHDGVLEDVEAKRLYKHKSSVNIMFGCNNFCTYCIVPFVRGRERSRDMIDIIEEIKALADDGVIEIQLLGQNVNSYGNDLDSDVTFPILLREIAKIEKIKRIRFMTSHPKDISDELIFAMRDVEKIERHIHLPFQSGSSKILDLMNRRYTKEQYLSKIDKIKKEIPNVTISSDIIVGFPFETEEDFLETVDVVEKVSFHQLFTFIYSKRDGTPAVKFDDQIPEEVTKDRFSRLLKVVDRKQDELNAKMVGNVYKVLPEVISKNDSTLLTGRTETNMLVHFKADESLIGQIVDVKIVDFKTHYLVGEML